jgi:tetratricopeptide (TPR) repeat protein
LPELGAFATQPGASAGGNDGFDPLFDGGPICSARTGGPPAVLRNFILAKTETAPFQPVPAEPALGEKPVLYDNLGKLTFKAGTNNVKAQAWFDQGVRLAFGFNHAEAQRAFREAQKLDPRCALCFWGEALILGPNINVPMMPDANAPALAALAKASELAAAAPPRDRALIEALAKRYAADPKAVRADLDAAYARAMEAVAKQYPADDTVQVLYAEALMDTQPWDYWEAAGTKPKGNGAAIVATLETVLQRNPDHPGAIHLYIHAMEASTHADKALPYANRLGGSNPAPGTSCTCRRTFIIDWGCTARRSPPTSAQSPSTSAISRLRRRTRCTSPPTIRTTSTSSWCRRKSAATARPRSMLRQARRGDTDRGRKAIRDHAAGQGGALHDARAVFRSGHDPQAEGAASRPCAGRYDVSLRAALASRAGRTRRPRSRDRRADPHRARGRLQAVRRMEYPGQGNRADRPPRCAGAPGRCKGRPRQRRQGLRGRGVHRDSLSYTEPPYWYYPVRQSLASVQLRQGKLDDAEKSFRESLARVRNNGWALAGLAETYRRKGDATSEHTARRAFAKACSAIRQGRRSIDCDHRAGDSGTSSRSN